MLIIDHMAEKYGMLPSEVLERATTQDLMIYNNANMIKLREDRKSRGESINDTFNKSEIEEMYNNFKKKQDGIKG